MKKMFAVMILSVALAGAEARAQEHKHAEQKAESKTPVQKETDPAKTDGMKCCEGMEKMGEIKAGMPMKSEMKAKMMEKMKEKMADKAQEKKSSDLPAKGQAEKSQTNTDAHQH